MRWIDGVRDSVLIGFLAISSRSGFGLIDNTNLGAAGLNTGVGANVCPVRIIDPDDPANILLLLAFELTQAAPRSSWLNDFAKKNILSILVTLDTSHLEMSQLKDVAL